MDASTLIPILLDWTLRVGLTLHIIWRRRPVAASLAWIAVIMLVPVAGLVLYLLLGENRLGQRRLRRQQRLSTDVLKPAAERWHAESVDNPERDTPFGQIAAYGLSAAGIPPLRGNHAELIADTDGFHRALAEAIDAATDHVHLQTFIWAPAPGPDIVADACERAARRGVDVRIFVDNVGGLPLLRSETLTRLKAAGAKIAVALPVGIVRALLLRRLDIRNHRKIVIIDACVAFTGSHNMTGTSFKVSRRHGIGPWIDASVRLTGPAVQALQVVFLKDWQQECAEHDRIRFDLDRYCPTLGDAGPGGSVSVIPSGPGQNPDATEQAFLTAIYSAKNELVLTTPYFAPSESIDGALRAAAARGVKVTLVLPKRSDAFLAAAAGRGHYQGLLDAGVRIMLFRGGLLHAKTITADRSLAMVGSANIDMRSFRINFEVNLFLDDDEFTLRLRRLQQMYIGDSHEVTADAWRARRTYKRLTDNAAGLLSPLL